MKIVNSTSVGRVLPIGNSMATIYNRQFDNSKSDGTTP